jgi:two-component system chemotaxis response regulator CheY
MLRILIVDDQYANRSQLKALLSAYGDCDSAGSAKIALMMYEQAHEENMPYDLITLDIEMPDKNGHQVLTEIRAHEEKNKIFVKNQEVKVLMVSVKDTKEDIIGSFREGCEGYLIKPVTPDKLKTALAKVGINVSGEV